MEQASEIKSLCKIWGKINRQYSIWEQKHNTNHYVLNVLYALYADGLKTQKEICENFQMPKQTVNTVIINLKKEGFVEISFNPDDKREKYIILTKSGRNYAKSAVEPLINLDNKVVKTMGKDLYEKLVEVLNEYAKALEKNIKEN